MTTQPVEVLMDEKEARRIIRTLNTDVEKWHTLGLKVGESFMRLAEGEAWKALGYPTWADMIEAEVTLPNLDRETRREVVTQLDALGMSGRAIATTLSVDESTVREDKKSTAGNPAVDDEGEPTKRIGLDGKARRAPTPRPPKAPSPKDDPPDPSDPVEDLEFMIALIRERSFMALTALDECDLAKVRANDRIAMNLRIVLVCLVGGFAEVLGISLEEIDNLANLNDKDLAETVERWAMEVPQ